MNLKTVGTKLRPKSRAITYNQIGTYLSQKKMPEPLIEACVGFLKELADDNGETSVGPRTMRSIIDGTWYRSEVELEAMFHQAPMPIRQYALHVTSAPDMPPESELVRPVERCSAQAQWAYLFLSEAARRVVYGMMYEPDHIWRVVRFYDEEPITTIGIG